METSIAYDSDWFMTRLNQSLIEVRAIADSLKLSIVGIGELISIPELYESLNAFHLRDRAEAPYSEAALARAYENAASARSLIMSGCLSQVSHTAIALWGCLESTVEDLVADVLQNHPPAKEVVSIRKLKIPLCEFETLTERERAVFIVKELSRSTSADLKKGVGRFESILEVVGLSGLVPSHVRKRLFELSQVRNVLVHRMGVADSAFCTSCPEFGVSVGDRLNLTMDHLDSYWTAATEYFLELGVRVGVAFMNLTREEVEETIRQALNSAKP